MQTKNASPLHPIGIGTWNMGGSRDPVTEEVRAEPTRDAYHISAIRYSLAHGQNHVDTAEMYGAGHTEEVVGKALQGRVREDIFLASKLWPDHYGDAMPSAVEAMLQRLQTSYLDLLYIHTPQTEVPLPEYLARLDAVADRGLTRAIGVSNFDLSHLQQTLTLARHPIVALQVRYNVLFKISPELLAFCREKGITVVAYRPIERGAVAEHSVIKDIAHKHGATPSQIALAWLLQQPGVLVIPKASDQAHIDENLQALEVSLDAEDVRKLDAIPSLE